jgi:hypothetical protein
VISWYYYARQNWYQFDYDPVKEENILKKSVMQPSRYKMTFEECVLAEWTECIYPPGTSIHGAYSAYGGSHFSQVCIIYFLIILYAPIDCTYTLNFPHCTIFLHIKLVIHTMKFISQLIN